MRTKQLALRECERQRAIASHGSKRWQRAVTKLKLKVAEAQQAGAAPEVGAAGAAGAAGAVGGGLAATAALDAATSTRTISRAESRRALEADHEARRKGYASGAGTTARADASTQTTEDDDEATDNGDDATEEAEAELSLIHISEPTRPY